jgi:hypothetical protein
VPQNQIQTFSPPYLLSLRNRYGLALYALRSTWGLAGFGFGVIPSCGRILRPSALPRPAETGSKMCLFAMYFGHGVLTDKRQRIFGRQIDHTLDPGWSADHRRESHQRTPQRIYRRSSPHLKLKSVTKGCADPGSRCHGDGTHSNDLPGCVVGGVADITQPRARPPGSGRPSSRSRGHHLGMASPPPPRPPRGPGGPHVPTGSWGPTGGLSPRPQRHFPVLRLLGGGGLLSHTNP